MLRKSRLITVMVLISLALSATLTLSDTAGGRILGGSEKSPVKIDVFSDFQCSACREFYLGTVRQILQEYASKDKVCIVYHEYPLPGHKYSWDASRYAEAAAKLGVKKLLLVMDALFMDQAVWSQDGSIEASMMKALPREDFQKLKQYLKDSDINLSIEREIQLGNNKQIKSTPTLFISYPGKQQKVEGLVTYLVLKQFIDAIVK
jgi:protein-disulfide isomerase